MQERASKKSCLFPKRIGTLRVWKDRLLRGIAVENGYSVGSRHVLSSPPRSVHSVFRNLET